MARFAPIQPLTNPVIHAVSNSLESMGVEQYLMAFLFLASYSMALSQFIGVKGRRYAVAGALTAAITFAARTDPFEHGVLVVAVALVVLGGFALAVWGLWALLGGDHAGHPLTEEPPATPPAASPAFEAAGAPGPATRATRPAPLPALR